MMNSLNLQVQQSPSTTLAFEDVVVLNLDGHEAIKGEYCFVISESGKKLILPFQGSGTMQNERVGLSNRQRQFLDVEMNDSIFVTLGYDNITVIPLINRVELLVSAYFLGGKPADFSDKIPLIKDQFRKKFSKHSLNQGHTIPLKINGMLFNLKIARLSCSDVDYWSYGVMSKTCEVFLDPVKYTGSDY